MQYLLAMRMPGNHEWIIIGVVVLIVVPIIVVTALIRLSRRSNQAHARRDDRRIER